MIDVHCHLNFHSFKNTYDKMIQNAKKAGVEIIINTGTKLDSSELAEELANKYNNLYAIIGIHPHHADKPEENYKEKLKKLAQNKKVVGIGEIGLDYYSYKSNGIVDPKLQKNLFEEQLQLAHDLNLPIQIHNRHAGKDVIEILTHHKNLLKSNIPGMFHCFAGSKEILTKALDLGFYIGFDGNLTYPSLAPGETVTLSELAKATPIDRIVTETDSPFLTPIPHRGTQNQPAYVIIVGQEIAKIKGLTFEEVAQETTQNAKNIFL